MTKHPHPLRVTVHLHTSLKHRYTTSIYRQYIYLAGKIDLNIKVLRKVILILTPLCYIIDTFFDEFMTLTHKL